MEFDLVSRINNYENATYYFSYMPEVNKVLAGIVKNYVNLLDMNDREENLLHKVWYEDTTFRKEYEKLGQAGFLSKKGTPHLIGNNSLERSITLLDRVVPKALKTDLALTVQGLKKYHGNKLPPVKKFFAKQLEKVGFAQKVDTMTIHTPRFRGNDRTATKWARKKKCDICVINEEKYLKEGCYEMNVSFYKLHEVKISAYS